MIYSFTIPEMRQDRPDEFPSLTGRYITAPVVNCPIPSNGDRFVIEQCDVCQYKNEITAHFVDCKYAPSQQEKDEKERRRKGMGANKPASPVPMIDPGYQPKNVFTPKK